MKNNLDPLSFLEKIANYFYGQNSIGYCTVCGKELYESKTAGINEAAMDSGLCYVCRKRYGWNSQASSSAE